MVGVTLDRVTARLATLVVGGLALLLSACGNSGDGTLVHVQGYDGVMDCPSDLYERSVADISETASGSATAEEALQLLTPDLGLPPGSPKVDSDAADTVTYLFADSNGLRLGRVVVTRGTGGWFVTTTERCG